MAIPQLAGDFREFLKLLSSNRVEYLLIGGYAVGIHGYVRATNDLDIRVGRSLENATKVELTLKQFGFLSASFQSFVEEKGVVRMGVPPLRLKMLTSISGADFGVCYEERIMVSLGCVKTSALRPLQGSGGPGSPA
jgi:hypothetical protein